LAVSAETFQLLTLARSIAAETGGSFDPTFRPLSLVWRIEDGDPRERVPTAEEIEDARSVVGFRGLILDPGASTARLAREGMSLGIGGIGKGWAADRVASVLRARGIRRFLIDAGGDLVIGEAPSGAHGWKISVEGPDGAVVDTRTLTETAVATSAHHKRFREIDGVRYSHIIDPRSGRPATWLPSVTIRCKDGAEADAYATAVSVLGAREGMAFVERKQELEALLITADGVRKASSGW
jgi:thiamine biosynthesis lipoprotein